MDRKYGDDYRYLPLTSVRSGEGLEAASDLYSYTVQIVNVCFIGHPGSDGWVLVDAGMPKSAKSIISAAEARFGSSRKPKGIVLTHGHFDHVGAILELLDHWDVPVFAHEREMPYLTGKQGYAPPNPAAGGGLVARMSFMFPNEPVDLGDSIEPLPAGGMIPVLPDWRWVHTPGHTPGHVSLFRDRDRALVAGDAFVNVKQESVYKVLVQEPEINGPPKYFTTDWEAARRSVEALADLNPQVAVTGHGQPVSGERLSRGLRKLADEF